MIAGARGKETAGRRSQRSPGRKEFTMTNINNPSKECNVLPFRPLFRRPTEADRRLNTKGSSIDGGVKTLRVRQRGDDSFKLFDVNDPAEACVLACCPRLRVGTRLEDISGTA